MCVCAWCSGRNQGEFELKTNMTSSQVESELLLVAYSTVEFVSVLLFTFKLQSCKHVEESPRNVLHTFAVKVMLEEQDW